MDWKYVKKLEDDDSVDDFERFADYKFCRSFKECVMSNNGGRPPRRAFDTAQTVGRELKSFLSFNRGDRETVWKCCEKGAPDGHVPFAIDGFGKLICFGTNNGNVVFVNHEDMSAEFIAEDFDAFLASLYE